MRSTRARCNSENQTKDKWHLVQFVEDGIWLVCTSNQIKKDNKGSFWCKWPADRKWYRALIKASGDETEMKSARQAIICSKTLLKTDKEVEDKNGNEGVDINHKVFGPEHLTVKEVGIGHKNVNEDEVKNDKKVESINYKEVEDTHDKQVQGKTESNNASVNLNEGSSLLLPSVSQGNEGVDINHKVFGPEHLTVKEVGIGHKNVNEDEVKNDKKVESIIYKEGRKTESNNTSVNLNEGSSLLLPSVSQLSLTELDYSIIRQVTDNELQNFSTDVENPIYTELASSTPSQYDKMNSLTDENENSSEPYIFQVDSEDEYQPNFSDENSSSLEICKQPNSSKLTTSVTHNKNEGTDCSISSWNLNTPCSSMENNATFLPQLALSSMKEEKGSKRRWDKNFYCEFCKKFFKKLPRHWYTCHSSQPEVDQILSLDKKSEERTKMITALQNRGAFLRNSIAIQSGEGEVMPKRRCRSNNTKALENYLPCEYCKQMLSKHYLALHQKKCSFRNGKRTEKVNRNVRALSMLMLPVGPNVSTRFKENILSKMSGDNIFKTIRYDQLILMFGESEFARLGHDTRYYRSIIDRCRELGRLLLAATDLNPAITKLKQLISPKQYQLFKNSVKKVAGFNEVTSTFLSPSLALKIGMSIKKCTYILKGDYLEDSILRQEIPKLDAFLAILESKWAREVTCHAYRTLNERKWNNTKTIPFAKDIQILNNFLSTESKRLFMLLQARADSTIFAELSEITLVSVIILNRRRVGEVQYMQLSEYQKACSANTESDVYSTLTEIEKELTKTLVRLIIKGKRGRGVPVILTESLQRNISLMNARREECGVDVTNKYLFPSLKNIGGHYFAHKSLQKYSRLAGCGAPETITSTRLRKHIAVMSQLLNLKDNELDSLAQFMGHDIRVHREYYRLSDETIQLAKISKILLNMEKGNIEGMKGKSLEEITIEAEDILDEEDIEGEDTIIHENNMTDEDNFQFRELQNIPSSHVNVPLNSLTTPKRTENKYQKRKIVQKKAWTDTEVHITLQYFSNYLSANSVPGKKIISVFLQEKGNKLQNRTWSQIKDFLVRKIKKKSQ